MNRISNETKRRVYRRSISAKCGIVVNHEVLTPKLEDFAPPTMTLSTIFVVVFST